MPWYIPDMSGTSETNNFTIELARGSDVASILEINKTFFTEYSHDESFFREGVAAERVFVARSGDVSVGYLICQVWWGNTPFLALLRVLPEFRGRGIGKTLLASCEEKLRKEGRSALISSSENINPDGNAFHRKMGFEPIGTLRMMYGEENFYRKNL